MANATKQSILIALFGVVGIVLLSIVSWSMSETPPLRPTGQASTVVAGRSVAAISTRSGTSLGITGGNESATAYIGSLTVKVTGDVIALPDGRRVPIPTTCQQIELWEDKSGVKVMLDGVEVK